MGSLFLPNLLDNQRVREVKFQLVQVSQWVFRLRSGFFSKGDIDEQIFKSHAIRVFDGVVHIYGC